MTTKKKRSTARCNTCGKAIRIPKGWSAGSAARRHYWRRHREIMLGRRSANDR